MNINCFIDGLDGCSDVDGVVQDSSQPHVDPPPFSRTKPR